MKLQLQAAIKQLQAVIKLGLTGDKAVTSGDKTGLTGDKAVTTGD